MDCDHTHYPTLHQMPGCYHGCIAMAHDRVYIATEDKPVLIGSKDDPVPEGIKVPWNAANGMRFVGCYKPESLDFHLSASPQDGRKWGLPLQFEAHWHWNQVYPGFDGLLDQDCSQEASVGAEKLSGFEAFLWII